MLVGLDAAEFTLLRRLAAEGCLPNIAALLGRGCTGVLRGGAELFAGGVWPTFYTGLPVAGHGLYHNKLWRQERMRCERKGWLGIWLRAVGWMVANQPTVLRRRREVQRARRSPDRAFLSGGPLPFTPGLASGGLERLARRCLDRFVARCWRLVRPLL